MWITNLQLILCMCAELLHIPPNSKDAAIFSPGGDKGTDAGPGKFRNAPINGAYI